MHALAILVLTAAISGSGEEETYWRLQDDIPVERDDGQEEPIVPRGGKERDDFWDRATLSATAVYTGFDSGISLESSLGAEIALRIRTVRGFYVNLVGMGWDTENDTSERVKVEADVTVLGVGLGIGYRFERSRFYIDIGLMGGVMRYESDLDEDKSPFLRLLLGGGAKIGPVDIGITVMADHVNSSFNRKHTHLFHHYSGALSIGYRF